MAYFSTSGGKQIYYEDHNAHNKKVVFFIHGNSSSSAIWHYQLQSALLQGYRLIAPDLPANGRSEGLENYSLASVCGIVKELIAYIVPDSYALVGFSLGAAIVAELIGMGVKAPAAVCLADATIIGTDFGIGAVFNGDFDISVLLQDSPDTAALDQFAAHAIMTNRDGLAVKVKADFLAVKAPFRTELIGSIGAGNFSDEVGLINSLACPVCVINGKEDRIITGYLEAAIKNKWRNKIVYIENAGHYSIAEQPELFTAILVEYLDASY